MKIQITKTNRLMSLTVLLILVHCSIVTFAQPGAIDPSFTPPVFKNSARIRAIVPLPDGSVFVAGHFNEVNGVARTNLARLKPDGSLDTAFSVNGNFNYYQDKDVYAIAFQQDGKIIIAGDFQLELGGVTHDQIARLNADGRIDPTFGITNTFNNTTTHFAGIALSAVTVLTNGTIIATGDVSGPTVGGLAFIDGNGRQILKFPLVKQISSANTILVQPDGNLLVGDSVDFRPGYKGIHRFRSTGETDASFNIGVGITNSSGKTASVFALALQTGGKILVGGDFDRFNSSTNHGLVRLNSDGGVDPLFQIGSGADGVVYAIAALPDGKVLVAGDFLSFRVRAKTNSDFPLGKVMKIKGSHLTIKQLT